MRRISWQAKRQAERAMTLKIVVERDTGVSELDSETLVEVPVVDVVWQGHGKIAPVTRGERDTDVAGAVLPVGSFVLHVPVDGPDLFAGDSVRVVADRFGGMAGRVFSVLQPSRRKTHATALRVPVSEVTVRVGLG